MHSQNVEGKKISIWDKLMSADISFISFLYLYLCDVRLSQEDNVNFFLVEKLKGQFTIQYWFIFQNSTSPFSCSLT